MLWRCHRLLDRKRRHRRDAAVGIVALHMAGAILHQRLALVGARRLRAAGQGIHLGDDGDLGPAAAVFGPKIGRHAGAAEFHLEACRRQRVLEQLGALEFLHPELAEVEQRVADIGHLLGVAIDHLEGELLARIRLGLLAGGHTRERKKKRERQDSLDGTPDDLWWHGFPRGNAITTYAVGPDAMSAPQQQQGPVNLLSHAA